MSTEPAWKSWPAPAEGQSMWEWQDNRCAICGCSGGSRNLAEDHCHSIGLIRGLLCTGCNTGEGRDIGRDWEPWRSGDNPAHAYGWYRVYVNRLGVTDISSYSELGWYPWDERKAYLRAIADQVRESGEWPREAPETAGSRARKAEAAKAEAAAALRIRSLFDGARSVR